MARHVFLSQHLERVFGAFGVETANATGLQEAGRVARHFDPDVVICDYDLLAMLPLGAWERDARLGLLPVIAVSLTRRPAEANLLDANGIASAFLYLPTLSPRDALRLLAGVRRSVEAPATSPLDWGAREASTTPTAP